MFKIRRELGIVFDKTNLPSYLKKDYPNSDLIPCKEYISQLPDHIERPDVEHLNDVLTKIHKGISKVNPGKSQSRRKSKKRKSRLSKKTTGKS